MNPDGTPEILWTREKLEAFKIEYNKHKADPNAVFQFDGHDFLVGYAGYLIEYLDSKLTEQ